MVKSNWRKAGIGGVGDDLCDGETMRVTEQELCSLRFPPGAPRGEAGQFSAKINSRGLAQQKIPVSDSLAKKPNQTNKQKPKINKT